MFFSPFHLELKKDCKVARENKARCFWLQNTKKKKKKKKKTQGLILCRCSWVHPFKVVLRALCWVPGIQRWMQACLSFRFLQIWARHAIPFACHHLYHPAAAAAVAAKSLQSCPTLCDPIDGSPPGSPIPVILQARTLEWVAISFSNAWKWSRSVVSDS